MTGNIFNIQRFSTSDGPGIRTTVFLKGCPLSCAWCHNPESKSCFPEIVFDEKKCISCHACENVCKNKCHLFEDIHTYLRSNCCSCFECTQVCFTRSLEVCGKQMTSDEVVSEVMKDFDFYIQSGGGMTLSGGEPLFQFDFSLELLKKAKEKGIHTAIETSGYFRRDISELCGHVDLWLFDIKHTDDSEHIKYTGVSNEIILENLESIDRHVGRIVLRCPVIPDVNMTYEHFEKVAALAEKLDNVCGIDLEPYHPLGKEKARQIGKQQQYDRGEFLDRKEIQSFAEFLRTKTSVDIKIQ